MKRDPRLLKDLSWTQRYPRLVSICGSILCIGFLYSGIAYNVSGATKVDIEKLVAEKAERDRKLV